MHCNIQKLPSEPITIWTPTDGWDWVADTPQANADFMALWEVSDEQVFHIVNTEAYQFDLEGLSVGAAAVAFGENALYAHPKLKTAIIVTQDPKVLFAIKTMIDSMKKGSGAYKAVPMLTMSTLDEALAYCRQHRG